MTKMSEIREAASALRGYTAEDFAHLTGGADLGIACAALPALLEAVEEMVLDSRMRAALRQECPECGEVHATGADTLPCYKRYLKRRLAADPEFRHRVQGLLGKTLGCFCHPKPCHGDVLVKYLNWRQRHPED